MNKIDVFRMMGSISRRAMTQMNHEASKYGLNNNLFLYLLRIVENEGIAQSELVSLVQVDKTTISRAISKLEKLGFIRTSQEEGKKYKRLYSSKKGLEVYPKLVQLENNYVNGTLERLTEGQVFELFKLLEQINLK
ncbi:MarR family transcriptional regulator [Streptococcaceae bacterium ESL0687]|nr:MarR family transcriptional regulator [Streptococcaceae bacterium ESL0687]